MLSMFRLDEEERAKQGGRLDARVFISAGQLEQLPERAFTPWPAWSATPSTC